MGLINSINANNTYNFVNIEKQLENQLHPISPREDFIYKLRDRLTNPPSILYENPEKGWGLVILFAGLFSGVLITWVVLMLIRKKPRS